MQQYNSKIIFLYFKKIILKFKTPTKWMILKNVKTYGAVWTKLSLAFFFFFPFFNPWKRAKSPLNNNGLLSVSLSTLLLFLQEAPLCSSFSNPSNFASIAVEFEKKVYRVIISNVSLRFRIIIFFSWRRV